MKWNELLLLLLPLMFMACGGTDQNTETPTQEIVQLLDDAQDAEEVQLFRADIQQICDSIDFCFQAAQQALDEGKTTAEVQDAYRPRVVRLEQQIQLRSDAFRSEVKELGISQQQARKLSKEVSEQLKALMRQYQQLKTKGVDLR